MTYIEKSIAKLQRCFPGSYITDRNELIVHPRTNQYIILENLGTEEPTEDEIAWCDLVAKRLTLLSQTKWQVGVKAIHDVFVIREDTLGSFWTKVAYRCRITRCPDMRGKHHIERT